MTGVSKRKKNKVISVWDTLCHFLHPRPSASQERGDNVGPSVCPLPQTPGDNMWFAEEPLDCGHVSLRPQAEHPELGRATEGGDDRAHRQGTLTMGSQDWNRP